MKHTKLAWTAVSAALALSMGTAPAAAEGGSGKAQAANTSDTRPMDTRAGPPVHLNEAQQLLTKNTTLRLKLQSRLPGRDVIGAASGFRNLGPFVAAVNVSYNNPGVSFRSLKSLMTGEPPMSLGQALQRLRGLDAATANTTANTALAQADGDILATSAATKRARSKAKS